MNFGRDEEEEQEVGRQNQQTRQEEAQEDGEGLNNVATEGRKKSDERTASVKQGHQKWQKTVCNGRKMGNDEQNVCWRDGRNTKFGNSKVSVSRATASIGSD